MHRRIQVTATWHVICDVINVICYFINSYRTRVVDSPTGISLISFFIGCIKYRESIRLWVGYINFITTNYSSSKRYFILLVCVIVIICIRHKLTRKMKFSPKQGRLPIVSDIDSHRSLALQARTLAPDFTRQTTPDHSASLSQFRGNPIILAYPADFSPFIVVFTRCTVDDCY